MPSSTQQRSAGVLSPLPRWLRRTVAYGIALLVLVLLGFVVVFALLKIGLVSFALLAAVLLSALLSPLANRAKALGVPSPLAAVISIVVLLGFPTGIGVLIYSSVVAQVDDLGPALGEALSGIRDWLENGPLDIDPSLIDDLSGSAAVAAEEAAPGAVAGTTTVARLLLGIVLTVFAVFFLVKDGDRMWRWALRWVPTDERDKVDGSGRVAWQTLTSYVRGTALVALVDAVGIGLGLVVLQVPLWLSLTLLTFVGGFVPILGAAVAGVVAVLVTLVTNGPTDAAIVLVIVLVVQQVESNLLQPLIMGQVVRLHPLVIACAVASGTLVLGIAGAILAVPVVAVGYRVVSYLADHESSAEVSQEELDEHRHREEVERVGQAHRDRLEQERRAVLPDGPEGPDGRDGPKGPDGPHSADDTDRPRQDDGGSTLYAPGSPR